MSIAAIPYVFFKLENGLTVIVREDHAAPIVSIAVVFNVGSRAEEKGRSGFAHLFEHMMFQGSANLPKQEHSRLIESRGGVDNGFTMRDFTAYYETLPSGELALGLWLEADRMRSLAITQENFDNQKDVVQEEKRMRYDNQPYMNAIGEEFSKLLFQNWVNAHSTIGSFEDLDKATVDDLKSFFRLFYAPNNAVLCVAGDVAANEVKDLTQKYFADIPKGQAPVFPDTTEPRRQGSPMPLTIKDRLAPQPALLIGWHAPGRDTEDYLTLALLGSILAHGNDSRLYQTLVKDKQWALDAQGGLGFPAGDYFSLRDPSQFALLVHYKDKRDTQNILNAIHAQIEQMAKGQVTQDELGRAQHKFKADVLDELQSSENLACWLGIHAWLHQGNPQGFSEAINRFFREFQPQDIAHAASLYLQKTQSHVLVIEPDPKAPAPPIHGDMRPKTATILRQKPQQQSLPPGAGAIKSGRPLSFNQFNLENGLSVVHILDKRLPFVKWRLAFPVSFGERPAPAFLANTQACADLLTAGTRSKNNAQIEAALAALGAEFEAGSGHDHFVIEGSVLKETTTPYFELVHEFLTEAVFPEDELKLWQENTAAMLAYKQARAGYLGTKRYAKELFGSHRYATIDPEPEDIASVTRASLFRSKDETLHFARGVMVVVGDIEEETLRANLSKTVGTIKGAPAAALGGGETPFVFNGRNKDNPIVIVHRPGSQQSTITLGHLTIKRKDPAFYPMVIMNAVLGNAFTSRLVENIREEKGYTYAIGSQLDMRPETGVFSVSAPVRTEVTAPALREIIAEIIKMKDAGITPKEFEMARNYLMGLDVIRLGRQEALTDRILGYILLGLPLDEITRYRERLAAISIEAVAEAAKTHLNPKGAVIVVEGDADKIQKDLETVGPTIAF